MSGGRFRNIFVYLIILAAAMFLFLNFSSQSKKVEPMPISDVAAEIKAGRVEQIIISGDYSALSVEFKDRREPMLSRMGDGVDVVEVLRNLGVSEEEIAAITIDYQQPSGWASWMPLLSAILPAILFVGLFYFLMRQAQGGNSQALSFGKSRARMFTGDQPTVTFEDVAGVEEAKEELYEVVEFLKEPEKFIALGARIPKGVLLVGAPGTGKTLMAKAVSGEAGVPFFSISGSEFVEMFVGVGASRVRDLFDQAKRHSPCLTGDTAVTLADGRQMTIQEMFERRMTGVKVPAMTDDFRVEEATVIGVTRRRPEDLYKITTVHSEIKATGNHLFPLLRQGRLIWVRADELQVGDFIASPRQIKTPQRNLPIFDFLPAETRVYLSGNHSTPKYVYLKDFVSLEEEAADIAKLVIGRGGFTDSTLARFPTHIPSELAYVCGLIASDGSFGDDDHRSIPFFNTELALHQAISSILQQFFKYQPRLYKNKKHYDVILPQGKKPQSLRDCYTTCINNKLLVTLLREINRRVLEFPEEHIAAWLRGVFDGDGSVKTSERCSNLTISAWDRAVNAKIREALHRVGIVVSESKRSRRGQDGNIAITGRDNILTFVTKVGSSHPGKAHKLDTLKLGSSSASRIDAIPVDQLLKDARLSIGMGQRDFVVNGRYRGHYVSQYERGLVVPSRASLQTMVETMKAWCSDHDRKPSPEMRTLEALCYGDILWARVVGIESLPLEDHVYDLVLDRLHNFVAERMFVHNCIVFVDEIDAVGRQRGAGLGGSHDEREQTLNQILVEMDGFDTDTNVIILAATNRPDILDPALLRPGRFDRRVVLDIPDILGRKGILEVHVKGKPLANDIDLEILARQTPGFVGADIASMVNEAAILAARANKKVIGMEEFEEAIERVVAGPERKSRIISDEEKEIIAYHEAGHAMVMSKLPHCDPVHKVSIVSRGMALGYTMPLPEEDRYLKHRAKFKDQLAGLLGGRAAEELMFNDVTTGAASDLVQATRLARKMVCEYGMSEDLGPMTFGKKQELIFLGREIAERRDYSEAVAQEIDREVRRFIDEAHSRAREILTTYRDKLIALAQRLIEKETLEGAELEAMLA